MANSTYSFSDISFIMQHPGVGSISLNGTGVGEVTISRSGDVSSQDVAADGSVMTSKMKIPNGTITVNVQQTSEVSKYLTKWFNYVVQASTDQWTKATIVVRDAINNQTITLTDVCPQKDADASYQQAGQQVSWTLMSANITRQ